MDGELTSQISVLAGFTSCNEDNRLRLCMGNIVASHIESGMIVSNQGGKNGNT
jgi:hypothetical protein